MSVIKAYLTLIGANYDPDYVTNELEIEPDSVRKNNDILPNGRQFGHTEWGIETQYEESNNTEQVLQKLIIRISEKRHMMRKVAEECNAQWNVLILVKASDDFPYIIFSAETIEFLYQIRAKLGFDTYLL